MKMTSKTLTYTLILGITSVLHAETLTYSNGEENRTISMENVAFTPTHPDACSEKKGGTVSEISAPVSKAVPIPETDSDGDGVVDSKDQCPDTPKGYQVDKKGCPQSVTLHIHFAFASNVIESSSNNDINELIQFINNNPASTITIVGHTDNIGTDERNQPRSEARAKALADKLIAGGIDSRRIKTSGKGSKAPVASNDTPQGRAENRRIEVLIH